MPTQPSATLKFADAEAHLTLRAKRVIDGAREIDLDQMTVHHDDGREESVYVYDRGGERKLGRIKQAVAGAISNYSDAVEPLGPEDEKRLWAIYEQLLLNVAA